MADPVFPVEGLAYCDESRQTGSHRYRSICCISLKSGSREKIEAAVASVLRDAGKMDFGFTDMRTVRDCKIASDLMDCALQFVPSGELQVRTLVWDVLDRRHGFGTDAIRNFERMYYHLLHDVLARRWALRSWELRPDEQSEIRWQTLKSILERGVSKTAAREVEIRHVEERPSADEPLIQLADVYAGLVAYYADKGIHFQQLLARDAERLAQSLAYKEFPIESSADRERFKLLSIAISLHKKHGIEARCSNSGLVLGGKVSSPVYTWFYTPVSPKDKAPRRGVDAQSVIHLYDCIEQNCAEVVQLHFETDEPYCAVHYAERNKDKIELSRQREERNEAEQIYREGSHFCENCYARLTPSEENTAEARYIGRPPKCPKCGQRALTSLLPQTIAETLTDYLDDFERRHDDRWRRDG